MTVYVIFCFFALYSFIFLPAPTTKLLTLSETRVRARMCFLTRGCQKHMLGREGPRKGVWSCELKRKPSISGRIFDYTRQTSPLQYYPYTAWTVTANNTPFFFRTQIRATLFITDSFFFFYYFYSNIVSNVLNYAFGRFSYTYIIISHCRTTE